MLTKYTLRAMENTQTPDLLTLKQVCEILQCHPNTLRQWDKRGVLQAVRLGPRRDRRYKKDDVYALLEQNSSPDVIDENPVHKSSPPRFIDLFAGVGGIRLGFERNGCECVFSSEWDKYSQDVYEANFGHRPAGDITKIETSDIPDHDILTGGFPCQAFSIIGQRKGFGDTRGTLFFDIERILRDKRPYSFLLENVRSLVNHDGGRTFAVIIESLKSLGYFVHWKVLNGLDFGVPQKRERTIIIGFRQNHPFEFPTRPVIKPKTLKDILDPDDEVDEKHFASEKIRLKAAAKVKKKMDGPTIWHENKSGNIGVHDFSCALRANGSYNYLLVNGIRRLTPREMYRLQGFPDSFKIPVSDCQARKQAGNSVVVPKMQALAQAMIEAMNRPPVPEMIQAKIDV